MRKTLAFAIVLIVGLVSCGENRPSRAISYDQNLVRCYADLLILREEMRLRGIDSTGLKIHSDSIAAAYGLRNGQIENMLDGYRKDMRTWRGFYERVIKRLDTLQQKTPPKQRM